MVTVWIYSGDRPSNGAKALASYAGFKRCRTNKFFKAGDKLVNWGCSDWGGLNPMGIPAILNTAKAIKAASNKLLAFQLMEDKVKCVPWTDDLTVAKQWSAEGSTIVARQKLTGHSGDGIIIIEKGEPVHMAPLYTKYIFKDKEFRVHVVAGNVVDTQRKIKDPNQEVKTWKVRSHQNGFIFARNNISSSLDRDTLATSAVAALGLDFGAVDIVEDKHGCFFVLEVNTAPGLEGQTIESYAKAFGAIANANQ